MLLPDELRAHLARRFARGHRRWLTSELPDEWPMAVPLGQPTEQQVMGGQAAVRAWVAAWQAFEPAVGVRLEWTERQWPRLGHQKLPERLLIESAAALAESVDAATGRRWRSAVGRAERLVDCLPQLAGHAALGHAFDSLADAADDDFERLAALLAWTRMNHGAGLFLRQLPVEGLDTKWIERRAALVTDLLRALRAVGAAGDDLHALLGLRRAGPRLRLRLLCPALRAQVGGLDDIEAPVEQLADLAIAPRNVVIVENLETGLALPDLAGTVAVMKLGAAVKLVGHLPWLQPARCLYWGDIDTHGFEILDRARSAVPHIESLLMDEATLRAHRALCVSEPVPAAIGALPRLTDAERALVAALRAGVWGERLRLEQERIPWAEAMQRLGAALAMAVSPDA